MSEKKEEILEPQVVPVKRKRGRPRKEETIAKQEPVASRAPQNDAVEAKQKEAGSEDNVTKPTETNVVRPVVKEQSFEEPVQYPPMREERVDMPNRPYQQYSQQPQQQQYYPNRGQNNRPNNGYNNGGRYYSQPNYSQPNRYPEQQPNRYPEQRYADPRNVFVKSGTMVYENGENRNPYNNKDKKYSAYLRYSENNYMPSPNDVFISETDVRIYGLRPGDTVEAYVRPMKDGDAALQMVKPIKVNGLNIDDDKLRNRIPFEKLIPIFPNEKFQLVDDENEKAPISSRIVDLFAPIGKGQRGLIVAQPKTGKTMLLKEIANSILAHHPEVYMIILLIDERPEEVTDMARSVNAEVISSTFDEPADRHVAVAGIVHDKAKRMVECGHDVVILLDSITRLARAYNTSLPASGKVLSGGVDAYALHKPKRFFGAARNIEGGGSLTIIATALTETGSKMDDIIFEEFKGTGNMELQLNRQLANRRIFPAVDIVASSTRRDDLLLPKNIIEDVWKLRSSMADMTTIEAMTYIKNNMEEYKNNRVFLNNMVKQIE